MTAAVGVRWAIRSVLGVVMAATLSGPLHARNSPGVHVVAEGDSLWTISRKYGCQVAQIQNANGLDNALIRPGQSLKIPDCTKPVPRAEPAPVETRPRPRSAPAPAKKGAEIVHTVASGESLWLISRQYDTSVQDIQIRNELSSTNIRPGQKLRIQPGAGKDMRPLVGQSVGTPQNGRLIGGVQLPPGKGYYRRNPRRAWGTSHVISHLRRVLAVVHREHENTHVLAIGDLSTRRGGNISGHGSHESGRDVDIGLYYKRKPAAYPASFVPAHEGNLDAEATWALVASFLRMSDRGGVERIFLDYDLQGVLYRHARKKGVSETFLGRVFQYPNGPWSPTGIIRHEPNHQDHLHIRFQCPPRDRKCR